MTIVAVNPETLTLVRYMILVYVVGWISGFVGGYSYVKLWLMKK